MIVHRPNGCWSFLSRFLAAALVVATVGCGTDSGDANVRGSERPPHMPAPGRGFDTPFITPGILQPQTLPAAQAQLPDDARVIGVTVDGRHRAYSVLAMSSMYSHVVNDVMADVPVTISYCDQNDCTRVFAGEKGGSPIDLWIGGWAGGEMALRYNEQHYRQTAQDIPLKDYPFVVTTWKEWREQHPDSDVYLGDAFSDQADARATPVRAPHPNETPAE